MPNKETEENQIVSSHVELDILDHFICPISLAVMEDPVICSDGNTYDRREITQWLQNHNTSPKTNLVLKNKILIPNYAVKSGIAKQLGTKVEKEIDRFSEPVAAKNALVINLMREIAHKQGIAVDQQRLIFAGKQLDPDRKLCKCGVKAGAVIHMVLRLIGGLVEAA